VKKPLFFLDTMIFIYQIEQAAEFANFASRVFGAIEGGRCQGLTSVITLAEILARPYQLKNLEAVYAYRSAICRFPNLHICEITAAVANTAAALSAKYKLALPDALQVSCAIENGANLFLTNDHALKKIKEVKVCKLTELRL
jgi:predicted nucleic acid-binding protein